MLMLGERVGYVVGSSVGGKDCTVLDVFVRRVGSDIQRSVETLLGAVVGAVEGD